MTAAQHHAGQEARQTDKPRPGWFLVERLYAQHEKKPRLLKDREFLVASIYEETAQDETIVLCAEIDGRTVDPYELWVMRIWPISGEEYHRRRNNGHG